MVYLVHSGYSNRTKQNKAKKKPWEKVEIPSNR